MLSNLPDRSHAMEIPALRPNILLSAPFPPHTLVSIWFLASFPLS